MRFDSDLPRSKQHVSGIAAFILIVLMILLFLDIWVTKAALSENAAPLYKVLKSVIENVMAGMVAAFILAIGYRWIVQIIDPADRVIEVPPEAIGSRLEKNARSTTSYTFVGNTASYFSAAILPILCARARKSGATIYLKVMFIDPREKETIEAYLRHKDRVARAQSGVASLESASWIKPGPAPSIETQDAVMAKLMACIYLCAYASRVSGINVEIYLRRFFTPFRADISEAEVVLTQESMDESAVAFSARGHFYSWYRKDAEALEQQCTTFRLSDDVNFSNMALSHPSSDMPLLESAFDNLMLKLFGERLVVKGAVRAGALKKISMPNHSYGR